MKPLDIKYRYLILFFIVVFISINSVDATDYYTDNDGVLSSNNVSINENNLNLEYNNSLGNNLNLDYDKSLGNNFDDSNVTNSVGGTVKTILSSNGLNMYYGTNSSVVGYLKTSGGKAIQGKKVKITINGNTYTKTTDSYGKVSLKITLKPGVYSTKFIFTTSSGYAASSCTVKVNVKKLPTTITTSNLVVNYNSTGKLTAILKDNSNNIMSGKNIKFTIDGNSYTKTTDSFGKAILSINNLDSKTSSSSISDVNNLDSKIYSCSISYDGDSIYEGSCKQINITINNLATNINSRIIANTSDIENQAINLLNYVERNNKLPQNVYISNKNISLSQYLLLISLDILNINNNDSSLIYLDDILSFNSESFKSTENFKEGILTKEEYIKIANLIVLSSNLGFSSSSGDISNLGNIGVSGYITSSLGNIGFNSLIYTFSNIIKSYNAFGDIPESINIYPWTLISNSKTVFISCDEIIEKSIYLKDYVESKHSLPSIIKINSTKSLVNINLAQFLKLELDTLIQIPFNSIQSLILKNYNNAPKSSETISSSSLDINSYYNYAIKIIDFLGKNNRAPNYVTTNKGNLGFESMIYTYSQILVSVSKFSTLPTSINIIPWNVVKNKATIFVSMDSIFEVTNIVENSVISKHSLENTLKCGGFRINLNQFLYLETSSIENINNCLYQSIILKSFSTPPNPSETLKEGSLSKKEYLKIANDIKNFLISNGRSPNYSSSSLGSFNYKNSIFIFSEILNYFNSYNTLPNNILLNPWSVLSNKNTLILNTGQIINLSYYIVNYVEKNHNTPNTIMIKDIAINKYQLLKLEVLAVNLINGNYAGNLILDKNNKYTSNSLSNSKYASNSYSNSKYSGDSLSSGFFNQSEYLNIGIEIENDIIQGSFTRESTSLGYMNIDNALYIYSQILTSYDTNGLLPDFIHVKSWSNISSVNTKFISIDNIKNVSKYIKNYIENNNSLPNYVNIDGNNVDMANLAYILAISLKMINGNLYTNISLDNCLLNDSDEDSYDINPHTINSTSYLAIASDFVRYVDINKVIPSYINTEFGNIRYESLILLYSTVFDYMDKGEFLDNTIILPWNIVTSSKFFTIDDISEASFSLIKFIESNHKIPDYILIDNYKVSIITYLELGSEAILNINGDLYSSLLAKNYDLNYLNYLNEFFNNGNNLNNNGGYNLDNNSNLSSWNMYSSEYIYLISQVNQYFNNNLLEFDNLLIENNFNDISIDLNAMVFLVSKILSSYKYYNSLPDFLDFISWNSLSNTIFLNQEDIVKSSFYLKDYVELNHKLPNNVRIGNNYLNIDQLLDVYTSCIYNINFNIYQSVILREFENSISSEFGSSNLREFENIISGDMDYYEAISLIFDLKESFDNGIVVSNLSNISLGDNIGFNSLLLMESSILNKYSDFINIDKSYINNAYTNNVYTNKSLSDIVSNITIIPWVVISNPDMIYNYRTCKVYNSIQEAIDDFETLDKDYIGVSKANIYENIVINKSIYLTPVTGYNISWSCSSSSNLNNPLIYLYSNSSVIEGFNFTYFTGKNSLTSNCIEIIGSSNTISNCIFSSNCQSGIIIKGDDNYIGFNQFNCPFGIIYGDYNTIESNEIYSCDYGIKLIDSIDSDILGNIIHSDGYSIYISNSSSNINFNSLISDKGLYIDSNQQFNSNQYTNQYNNQPTNFIDLNNNWWGLNNPNNLNYANYNLNNPNYNISCDSWLVLSLNDFIDYSTPSFGAYDVVLIGDVRYNNLHQDLGMNYAIDNLKMSFTTRNTKVSRDSGVFSDSRVATGSNVFSDISVDGECIYIINSSHHSHPSDVYVTLTLDNQVITKLVCLPSNNTCGVVNNRSGKSYYSIQEAIDDENTLNGDTILLNRGIFCEDIFIYKDIRLIANGTVYLNGNDDSKSLITVFSNNTVIDGLFIDAGEDNYVISDYGINTKINNCVISNSMVGLYALGSTNCSVVDCSFINNEYGSYLHCSNNIKFINCSFLEDSYGIFASKSSYLSVNCSKFNSCRISLDLVNCTSSVIANNEFNESYLGLELINNDNSIILDNLFYNNLVGCSIYNSTGLTSSNKFLDNILGDLSSFDKDIELQKDTYSCGPASLVTVLHKLGFMEFNQLDIINETTYANIDKTGTSLYNLLNYLQNNDINKFPNARCLETNSSNLAPLDIVLLDIDGNYHYSVIWNITDDWVLLADSTAGLLNVSRFSFDNIFSSYVLVLDYSNTVGRVFDSSNSRILNSQEIYDIYGDLYAEAAWTWLNTPIVYIPGYDDLDDNYGVLGQSIKLAGWFLLGIDDKGGLTPLNLALDTLSICSGFGLAERFGVSGSVLIEKLLSKPLLNKFANIEKFIVKHNIFKNYKTTLSILSNPTKFSLNKITTNILKLYENSYIANFAINYLNNNFGSLSSVLGISGSYFNAKDNILLVNNLIRGDGKSLINTKSTISSTLNNTNTALKAIYESTLTISNKVTKTVSTIKKTVLSINKSLTTKVNSLKTNIKSKINSIKTKVSSLNTKVKSSKLYKTTAKAYKTLKKTTIKVVSTFKKNIVNTTKRITTALNKYVKKLKFW